MQNINSLLQNFSQNQLKEINDFLNSAKGRQFSQSLSSAEKDALLKKLSGIDPSYAQKKLKNLSSRDLAKIINSLKG
ncbi:MAG: hypothetical protein SOS24_07320 [Clostridia bacterium]|nr:hypothetical protein [Clostridia bacterium]